MQIYIETYENTLQTGKTGIEIANKADIQNDAHWVKKFFLTS